MGASPVILDLTGSSDEDEDDDVVCLPEAPSHLLQRSSRRSNLGLTLQSEKDFVILEKSNRSSGKQSKAGREQSSQKSSQDSNWLDEDCCILDGDPSKVAVESTIFGNDSEDLVVTGESGPVACRDFPHARHLCAKYPFKSTSHEIYCSQCHCYVCEKLAPCIMWGDGTQSGDHCHASDKIEEKWRLLRKFNKSSPTIPSLSALCPVPLTESSPASRSVRDKIWTLFQPGFDPLEQLSTDRSFHSSTHNTTLSLGRTVADSTSLPDSEEFGESGLCDHVHAQCSSFITDRPRASSASLQANTRIRESTSRRGSPGALPTGSVRKHPLQIRLNRSSKGHSKSSNWVDPSISTQVKYARRRASEVSGAPPRQHERVANPRSSSPRPLQSVSLHQPPYSSSTTISTHAPQTVLSSSTTWVADPRAGSVLSGPDLDLHSGSDQQLPLGISSSSITTTVPAGAIEGQYQALNRSQRPIGIDKLGERNHSDGANGWSLSTTNPLDVQCSGKLTGKISEGIATDSSLPRVGGDSQLLRGGISSNNSELADGTPNLLIDFLMEGGDFWGDLAQNWYNWGSPESAS